MEKKNEAERRTLTAGERQEGEELQIDLARVCRHMLRRWLPVALAVVLGAALCGGWKALTSDTKYVAKAQLYLRDTTESGYVPGAPGEDATVIALQYARTSITQVEDLKVMATSGVVLDRVIEKLGLDMSQSALKKCISTASQQTANFVDISVSTGDGELSRSIANAVMEEGAAAFNQVNENGYLKAVAYFDATTARRSKPATKRWAAIGAALGLLLAVLWAFLKELFRPALYTPADVERQLGLPVLAALPRAKRERR